MSKGRPFSTLGARRPGAVAQPPGPGARQVAVGQQTEIGAARLTEPPGFGTFTVSFGPIAQLVRAADS
jgi:hypothetical protein